MKPSFRKVYGQRDPSKARIEFLNVDRPVSINPLDLGKPFHVVYTPSFYQRVQMAIDVHRTKVWSHPEYLYLGRAEEKQLKEYVESFIMIPSHVRADGHKKYREFCGMKIIAVDAEEFLRVGL